MFAEHMSYRDKEGDIRRRGSIFACWLSDDAGEIERGGETLMHWSSKIYHGKCFISFLSWVGRVWQFC